MRTLPVRLFFAFISLALVACSPNGGSGSSSSASSSGAVDGGGDGQIVTCQNDPRVDTYVANLSKTSAGGALKITLVSSDPAPPAVGTNTWIIRASDASGAPITNAAIGVASFMPDHGHGSSVKAVVTPQADGSYSVTPLYLFMGGVWRVTFSTPAGGADAGEGESVQFFFCIAG